MTFSSPGMALALVAAGITRRTDDRRLAMEALSITRRLALARSSIRELPDCRNKSIALTHLDDAEVALESGLHWTKEEAEAESFRSLVLALGFEARVRAENP